MPLEETQRISISSSSSSSSSSSLTSRKFRSSYSTSASPDSVSLSSSPTYSLISSRQWFPPCARCFVMIASVCIALQWHYVAFNSTISRLPLVGDDTNAIVPVASNDSNNKNTATITPVHSESFLNNAGEHTNMVSSQYARITKEFPQNNPSNELHEIVRTRISSTSTVTHTHITRTSPNQAQRIVEGSNNPTTNEDFDADIIDSTTKTNIAFGNSNNQTGQAVFDQTTTSVRQTRMKNRTTHTWKATAKLNYNPNPTVHNLHPSIKIERIYYINLKKNSKRRNGMEKWLKKQSIPYRRISAMVGESDTCVSQKNRTKWCKGISGLIKTNVDIIDHYNTSGYTLVLEDDIKIVNWKELYASIPKVPNDWDIIRFDCTGARNRPSFYPPLVAQGTFLTTSIPTCSGMDWYHNPGNCMFCGSTFAMLWKSSSLHKLRAVWSQKPYDDMDCRLATDELQSYCVNRNIVQMANIGTERSDITGLRTY